MRSSVQVTLAFAAAAALAGGAQAADTNVNAKGVVHKAGEGVTAAAAPDVARTPSPGGPVPIPYPNLGLDKDDAQKKSAKEAALKNKSRFRKSTGDEAGAVKEVVPGKNPGKGILLTPLDQNAPEVARQTPKTDFGSVLGRGAGKAADVALERRNKPGLPDPKAPKQPLEPVKQPVVVAPNNPVDAPPQPLPVKLGPPSIVAPPPQVTPPVAAPPVKVPVVVAPPVPVPVPVAPPVSLAPPLQAVVIQPVQPKPVLQTQPVLRR